MEINDSSEGALPFKYLERVPGLIPVFAENSICLLSPTIFLKRSTSGNKLLAVKSTTGTEVAVQVLSKPVNVATH